MYVYGMVGWVIFGQADPQHFGDIGSSALTMFVLVTLESLPEYLERGMEISPLAVPFFLSYIVVASFLVFNLFIGIVINSMTEAREEELARAKPKQDSCDDLARRLEAIYAELGAVAGELRRTGGTEAPRASASG